MTKQILCSACQRELKNRFFDKCMYCGHPIPEGHRLTSSEREAEQSRRDEVAEENRKQHEQFMKKTGKQLRHGRASDHIGDVSTTWDIFTGGDGGGGGE